VLIVDSLPCPEASDPKTLYQLKTGGEMFVCRLKAKWVKVNSGIKTVDILPDVRNAVAMRFYSPKDERILYMTYDNISWQKLSVEITETFHELPAADTVERGVEYVLLPSRVKYVTYDSAFRSIACAQKNFVYPIKDTGEEWITYDNMEWTLIDQDKSLHVVESLPAWNGLPATIRNGRLLIKTNQYRLSMFCRPHIRPYRTPYTLSNPPTSHG
jgi:hypothetical protein